MAAIHFFRINFSRINFSRMHFLRMHFFRRLLAISAAAFIFAGLPLRAQSTGSLQGLVTDQSGAVVPNAQIAVTNDATGITRTTASDKDGNYLAALLPVGNYSVKVTASGLQTVTAKNLVVEVSRATVQNFQLKVASAAEVVEVTGAAPVVESSTMTVGQVINQNTVQGIPLNGRHFVDLGLLVPGSVTPPQSGFLTAPLRGQGSFAINTAGQREDTVNFLINGINLNDQVQNQITFQPTINDVREFKFDNSTYSAAEGRSSGAIVNIATRSGTNAWHGEAYEYLRNDFFDARNFFNRSLDSKGNAVPIAPFKRNQFGGDFGGPIIKDKTFFFVSYEGLRQRQGIPINSGVLTNAQRTAAAASKDPAIPALLAIIPQANDPTGSRFTSSATAPVNIDDWTGDLQHNFSTSDNIHAFYAYQRDQRQEPTLQGNTIPGFGDIRQGHRQLFTLGENHVFSSNLVNDARIGVNRILISFDPKFTPLPGTFNINDAGPAIPQIRLLDSGLNFGGPAGFPSGRGDLTSVLNDTASWLHGNHSIEFGGEFRRFNNNNSNQDAGLVTFNTTADFITGNLDAFSITPGSTPSRISQNALDFFVQDNWKLRPNFTLELGLRYSWNGTPVEAEDRFVVFDPTTDSLVQVGTNGLDKVYPQSALNFQPRLGFAWDIMGNGKTILRAGYGLMSDQPVTNSVTPLASNPPFSSPIAFVATKTSPPVPLSDPTGSTASTVAPASINPDFHDAYVQSYNLNIQRAITSKLGVQIGYFGSKGTHLRFSDNFNQPNALGVRPFATLSATSPIDPGTKLGNIREISSGGNSNYNALWVSATQRSDFGLEFNTSYTYSKSLDENSLSTQGVILQDSFNPQSNYGLSDFDARHRFVFSGLYNLPFKGNLAITGWAVSSILQLQTGNPIQIVTGSGFNGTALTIRPNLLGDVSTSLSNFLANGNIQYLPANATCDASSKTPVTPGCLFQSPTGFGDLGRNSIIGPGFADLDFAIEKNTKLTERLNLQFRTDAFDLFNHPNFGQPIRTVSTAAGNTFGQITGTRFSPGDFGSSRQLQLSMKLQF